MRNQSRKVLLAQVAGRQSGRVTWIQMRDLGIDRATIARWVDDGYLHPELPRVYAVGHASRSRQGSLVAALLYAGPGAMLSHATAAWWHGLLDDQPPRIHVSTCRDVRSQPGIRVHQRRHCEPIKHNHLPTTTLPQTLLDLASEAPLRTVRRALAKADYANLLDLPAIEAQIGPGRPGSATLRAALRDHDPRLARTKSELEVLFLDLCQRASLPRPEVNVQLGGWEVDALFRQQRVAVELDGYRNHRSRAQVKRDRQKELALRALQCTPVRYSAEQVIEHGEQVIADLRQLLSLDLAREPR